MTKAKNNLTAELAIDPTRVSEHIVDLVLQLNNKYEATCTSKNVLKKIKFAFNIKMYLKNGYLDYYNYLKSSMPPMLKSQNSIPRLTLLFEEFEKIYLRLIFNNFALVHAYASNKVISHFIFTMEDKKIVFFKKLYHGQISRDTFNKKFGHYALNAYELSSQRFEEYSDSDLLKIARFVSNFVVNKKTGLKEYISNGVKQITPVLIALRELAKYNSLFIIRDIRYELLRIAQEKRIENIFDMPYDEIIKL